MISGKPFFSNHLKERESTRELMGSRTRTDAPVWHGRHEPSASRTIKLQRRRWSQWEDGAPLPGGQAKIKNARRGAASAAVEEDCSERGNGKRKRKGKKKNQTSPTDFLILIGSEGDSSIMDQWSLRCVLQGKEEKCPFASLLVLSQPLLPQCLKAEWKKAKENNK